MANTNVIWSYPSREDLRLFVIDEGSMSTEIDAFFFVAKGANYLPSFWQNNRGLQFMVAATTLPENVDSLPDEYKKYVGWLLPFEVAKDQPIEMSGNFYVIELLM